MVHSSPSSPAALPNDDLDRHEEWDVKGFWQKDNHVNESIALCGIVSREGRPAPHVIGAESVDYRDVSAVVRKADFVRSDPTSSMRARRRPGFLE